MNIHRWLGVPALGLAALLASGAAACAQKYGGVLNALTRNVSTLSPQEDLGGVGIWGTAPLFSNLVLNDPNVPEVNVKSIIPDMAERWVWSPDARTLTFKLRSGAKWHDGKPVTSADVKDTFDMVRGASAKRLKVNHRKANYAQVESITTNGDHEIAFHLKRPQPSLIVMLAAFYAPLYPAHVSLADMRARPIGSGPFRFQSYKPDSLLTYEKNPDFFLKARPYLDGIQYTIVRSVPTLTAALVANQADIAYPNDITTGVANTLRSAKVPIALVKNYSSSSENILLVHSKPPFNDPKLRQVLNLALDRTEFFKAIAMNDGVYGGAMPTPPNGVWGLPLEELAKLPGYGDPARNKEQARKIMAELGYGPEKPLRIKMTTQSVATYVTLANWTIAQLKEVWIEATLEQLERVAFYARLARREFAFTANRTSIPTDDPDVQYYENYKCDVVRNYSSYCNPEVDRMIDAQSAELDPAQRLRIVHDIERQLVRDAARPILGYVNSHFAYWRHVKNYALQPTNLYTFRFTDVWIER